MQIQWAERIGPTLLRMPSWLSKGVHEEAELALAPDAYLVMPGERWTVTVIATGAIVYSGIGPVEVVISAAPF